MYVFQLMPGTASVVPIFWLKCLAIANGTVAVNGLPAESSWPPAEGQECVVAGCGL